MAQDYSFSNCRISNPILQPGEQTVTFNGMAWSAKGMMHQVNPEGTSYNSNQSWESWLGTQQ